MKLNVFPGYENHLIAGIFLFFIILNVINKCDFIQLDKAV